MHCIDGTKEDEAREFSEKQTVAVVKNIQKYDLLSPNDKMIEVMSLYIAVFVNIR